MKIIRNPDKEILNVVLEGLRNSGGQCPCVPKFAWTEDTKCHCKVFRDSKECQCGLFVQVEEK